VTVGEMLVTIGGFSDIFVTIFNCIKLDKTWRTLFVADSAQTALSVLQLEIWNSSVYLDQAVTGIGASGGFGGDELRESLGFDGESHGECEPTHARDWQRVVQAACGRAVQIREARAEDDAHPS